MGKRVAVTLGLLAWTAIPARADDCAHRAPREAKVPADGARVIKVEAGAGALKVEGRAGISAVMVHGTACAHRKGSLDDVQVRASRQGDAVVVEAVIPEGSWGMFGGNNRLDLTIEVPAELAVEIDDGSGPVEVASVAAVRVEDGSGELTIRDVTRDVSVRDGSGSIDIAGVGGSVTIEQDGSGSIEVTRVQGNVLVRNDGSGSISVRDVAGDFSVRQDGSGGIDHEDVRGTVNIPRRH